MKHPIIIHLTLLFVLAAGLCHAEDAPRVEFFSPQGVVKGVRQVTARFSEPMTTFGDPRNAAPFDIACAEKGSGRWADVKNWVFDFDRDLPAGVTCSFTLVEGLKTLAGAAVRSELFSFSTGGPAIMNSRPGDGREGIDEEQIFLLTLDAEPDEASILANVRFVVEKMNEGIGIQIVKGEQRSVVLKAAGYPDNARTIAMRCRQSFPNKAVVKLVWGRGAASKSGVATTEDQVLTFTVRDQFRISFGCERTKANAPCIPMLPMRLGFSSPVPVEQTRKIVMKSGKKVYKPELAGDDEEGGETGKTDDSVRGVIFMGPFPEKKTFVIELPKEITDDAGRRPANRDKFPLQVATDSFPPLAKFAAPFGIVELHGDTAIPVTLRNVEPKVKARQLNPDEPHKDMGEKTRDAVIDKAISVGETLASWLPGSLKKKAEEKVAAIKGKVRQLPADREEKIIEWLRRVKRARRNKPILTNVGAEEILIPKPNGEKAFEVVGIPVKKPGFHIVELESPTLGAALLDKPRPMYVSTAALVTNMSAHFKQGRESSLVWVTSLDKGEPVGDAEVTIRDCKGKVYWRGKTDGSGIARTTAKLPDNPPFCRDSQSNDNDGDYYADNEQPMLNGISGGLFVFARKKDDLTFVHTSWDQGIERWRFNLPYEHYREHTIAHTVFDRMLVRAGETVHMKHFIRNHTMKGFGLRSAAGLPKAVLVMHRGSGQRYEFPLAWSADNTAETTMTVPKGAELGFYDVHLLKNASQKPKKKTTTGTYEEGDEEYYSPDGWESGFFRVEEFRLPLMKGVIEPPKEPAINASSVDVDLYVSHLSGGGAGGAQVRMRTEVRPRGVSFDDFEGYTFANGKVEAGVVKEEARDRQYDDEGDGIDAETEPGKPSYRTLEFVLDKSGALRAKIDDLPKITSPHTLVAELEFRDPNGEIQTVTGRVPLWSSKLLVGLKPDSWSSSADDFKFKTVVVDVKGKPVSGARVSVELFSRRHFSHRKRLVGGFYSYEHVTETKTTGPICEGTTDDKGLLACSAKSPVSGNVILQATVTDDTGNVSAANQDLWIAGKGEWWFDVADSDRIDLLPEKKFYDPGENARFQVRMPFRSATVLVTVEREGVIDAYVKKVSGKEPVISVPIKGNYAPNVFVSALCVRGRVAGTKPTPLFDPGKPTYRLGIGEIRVGVKAHELKVKVSADNEAYKVRGKARIRIRVRKADGGALPKGAEVAVAAVDEGLLELMPNQSWRLLEVMMGRRGCEVETSTAQAQVVGRRHYGLKALPAGGGGGTRSTRELFDTLLFWKGRVKLDAKGEAMLEIPLNDSLTSFTIVAVANAGSGLFGTGRTSIRTTQDVMIMSGLPPLVREGDRFTALFTVRNASNREMALTVTARPSWSSNGGGFEPVAVKLGPGEAKEVAWQAEVPAGIESATWEAEVREENGEGADRVKVSQRVAAAVPVRVYQATVTQVDKAFDLDVRIPDDAIKGRGGVNVVMRSKLTEGLGGVTHYMKNYPYTCMEQRVSKAIALKDDGLWKQIVISLPSHMDADGLVKYFPSPWLDGSPTLTSYILSITRESGRELPAHLIKQMEKGLIAFIEGKIRRESSFGTADLSIRKLAAVEALSQRGAAKWKLLSSVAVEPNLWPTSAVLDWLNVLKRTEDIPDRTKRTEEAVQILRSRLNFQGTVMNFSTESSDRLWWLMVSTDTNALRTLLAFMDEPKWRDDIPRLVRGAVARQYQGRWETTIANAWGVVAMERFTAKFESAPVTGTTRVEMAGTAKTADWGKESKGRTLSFPWPEGVAKVSLRHEGGGKPWGTFMSLAAIPLKEPLSSGYRIRKTVTPVEQREKNRWSRGDVARIRLEIEAQSDMTWVAVNDPVPAGATILGSGLGRDSALMTAGEKNRSWPVFEERAFAAYRAYYEYVPKGKFVVEYTVRINNEGSFRLPPTRVEALYAPEMFGEAPNRTLTVGE